ncbi:MAG: phenylalanine--tRNA ligase subunit alpha [Burkholderiales bacterium]|nr:phenylalanine--tRNA ligase subunit alpha [Phycisphaerae bacterium]
MSTTAELTQQIAAAGEEAASAIAGAESMEQLEQVRIRFLGKEGVITKFMKQLGAVPKEEKPAFGAVVNAAKKSTEAAIEEKKAALAASGKVQVAGGIDVTMPGIRNGVGRRHPIQQALEQVKSILIGMGFRYDDYPEYEEEYYNFDSLNTPDWHPSRDSHDSFYTKDGHVLRTHTTAFQIRCMKMLGSKPPIRAMTAGRCYRRDEIDATHYPIFNQIDVICIDRNVSFADLKSTLYSLLTALLGDDIKLRFRPSYFPFTTPSAEVDVLWRGRWMELLGAGMMRPEVLRNGGIDPDEYQGFAFGMGLDRLAMRRFAIDDIRHLYENEEQFLSQF